MHTTTKSFFFQDTNLFLTLFFSLNLLPFWGNTQITKETLEATWTADNGNGTFTNPLFNEEFSDPDMIRVGDDFYLTGTTMHAMPGLPVLHSKDLVNWELISYAAPRIDFGPELRLQNNKDAYGQGIWAPCLRYHKGMFYIFSNVNGHGTQVYYTKNPRGSWNHKTMRAKLHDVTVLFDDDDKIYAVWGYDEIKIVELTEDLMDVVPGTEKIIIERGSGAGEGSHMYKIDGKYYITNTNYDPICYQVCLRADYIYGPYEVNVISAEENFGVGQRSRLANTNEGPPFKIIENDINYVGCIPMHQGGIVQIQTGEWWGWSMLDYNSLGRVTALSPVTWKNGWPYFGLEGNLTRSPKTWIKPNTGFTSAPKSPFERDDDFNNAQLKNAWQWNHAPVAGKWSLTKRKGYLRLTALPADSFWHAKNSLTQRGMGPESYATTKLDISKMKDGDVAGLALLNLPYAWLGIIKEGPKSTIQFFDQQTQQQTKTKATDAKVLWLRAHCNFDTDIGKLSYSFDGENFTELGGEILMPYQLKTFQGVRYALFNYNTKGKEGGYVDFDDFYVHEPRSRGLMQPIPYNKEVTFKSVADNSTLANWKNFLRPVVLTNKIQEVTHTHFKVLDRGAGRVALQSVSSGGFVTVKGSAGMAEVRIENEDQGNASTFQWQEMNNGDIMLLSLYNHRYVAVNPNANSLCSADARGARPDHKAGACFTLTIVP
tara:strand:+ start:75374 stop:77509 length:2136 start_codon:yes stop_codon:yes gene_type:complete